MKVFIAGATGVLGSRLVEAFSERDHTVLGLSRTPEGDRTVEERGGTPRRGDLFDEPSVVQAIGDADVAIHAATAIPKSDSPSPEDWARNDRVRREGTRALTAAAAAANVDQFVQQSIVWVAAQPDGSEFDESSALSENPAVASAIDAEEIAREAGAEHGFEVSALRGGWFTAPDAYDTRSYAQGLVSGDMVLPAGADSATFSYVHADDAASAYVAAVESDETDLWHVVDDEPAPVGEYFDTFAEKLGVDSPERLPDDEAANVLGEGAVGFLTNSMPTSNERFRRDVGWEPTYGTYPDSLEQVVETWRADGTLDSLRSEEVSPSD